MNSFLFIDGTAAPIHHSGSTHPFWTIMRTPSGANRWEWQAAGRKGSRRGYAHSKAVAEVRAKRAYEELA